MKRLFLTAALLFWSPVSAWAGVEEGLAAYARADYAVALRELVPLAERGEVLAMLAVGDMYAAGQGVPADSAEAVRWYRRAAELSDPTAQVMMGHVYATGFGVPQDHAAAARWYGRAAAEGLAEGLYNLGLLYANGLGVARDLMRAHVLLSRALAGYPSWDPRREAAVRAFEALEARMTPLQRAEADRLARAWWPRPE
jgi:uncharacterized protein